MERIRYYIWNLFILFVLVLLAIPICIRAWLRNRRRKRNQIRFVNHFNKGIESIQNSFEQATGKVGSLKGGPISQSVPSWDKSEGETAYSPSFSKDTPINYTVPEVDYFACPICGYQIETNRMYKIRINGACPRCRRVSFIDFDPMV